MTSSKTQGAGFLRQDDSHPLATTDTHKNLGGAVEPTVTDAAPNTVEGINPITSQVFWMELATAGLELAGYLKAVFPTDPTDPTCQNPTDEPAERKLARIRAEVDNFQQRYQELRKARTAVHNSDNPSRW